MSPGGKSVKQPPALTLLECLRRREADVLRFLTDTAIPPTSNQAERDLRPAKTQRPEDQRPAPIRDHHPAPLRHSRLHITARKHGIGMFTAIKDALAGETPGAAYPRQRLNCTWKQSRTAIQL